MYSSEEDYADDDEGYYYSSSGAEEFGTDGSENQYDGTGLSAGIRSSHRRYGTEPAAVAAARGRTGAFPDNPQCANRKCR